MSDVTPQTRDEMMLEALSEGEGTPISVDDVQPRTRKELMLAYMCGCEGISEADLPAPRTREEHYLYDMCCNSGGGGGGGGSASVPWNDVTFIDYDGTVLHSYSLAEAQALTELPPLPTQQGLICQGWNWSLDDIKAQNGPVIVGAMYITDDGKTRIYITLQEGRTSPMLGVGANGTVTVDWGDGTEPDVLTGTGHTTIKWTPNHEYASAGDYVISLSVEGSSFALGGISLSSAHTYSSILRYTSAADNRNRAYQNFVCKVELGEKISHFMSNAFTYCTSLESITIPNYIDSIGTYAFQYCYALKSITFPRSLKRINYSLFKGCYGLRSVSIPYGVSSIDNEAFSYCEKLEHLTIPKSVTEFGYSVFANNYGLKTIVIPTIGSSGDTVFEKCHVLTTVIFQDGVTTIFPYMFRSCVSLIRVVIPSSISNIGAEAFTNCYGVRCYDFSNFTSVPSLGAANAFIGISADCQMLIPAALFDEWSTATNWAAYASYMVSV